MELRGLRGGKKRAERAKTSTFGGRLTRTERQIARGRIRELQRAYTYILTYTHTYSVDVVDAVDVDLYSEDVVHVVDVDVADVVDADIDGVDGVDADMM